MVPGGVAGPRLPDRPGGESSAVRRPLPPRWDFGPRSTGCSAWPHSMDEVSESAVTVTGV